MSNATLAHVPTPTDEQIDGILDATADAFVHQLRSPIMHTPSEQSLAYEEVTFPSLDGVPLEGWFIPADGSEKLIIANHPMGFSRSGIPTHLEPWRSIWRSSGNAFEGNFIPDYKILHDAGYNVLVSTVRVSLLGSALASEFVTDGRCLILSGKPGRGKTHLAVAIGYRAIQNRFGARLVTA